ADLWIALLDTDLKYQSNRPLAFDAKVAYTSLTVEKVLPTPDVGGFLIVGSMMREDLEGFAIKLADDLKPEFAFYMQHTGEDAFVGADVLKTGEYVLVGRTRYSTLMD